MGFKTLREVPDMEMLGDAGLLSREKLLAGEMLPIAEATATDDDDMV